MATADSIDTLESKSARLRERTMAELTPKAGPGVPATFRNIDRANREIGRLREVISWLHRYYERKLIEEGAKRRDHDG
jgi:hypothetical protein